MKSIKKVQISKKRAGLGSLFTNEILNLNNTIGAERNQEASAFDPAKVFLSQENTVHVAHCICADK